MMRFNNYDSNNRKPVLNSMMCVRCSLNQIRHLQGLHEVAHHVVIEVRFSLRELGWAWKQSGLEFTPRDLERLILKERDGSK